MVLRTVRIGDNIDIAQYDDGDHATAIDTDDQPLAIGQSAAGTHAIRQDELPALGNVVSSSANITDHAVVRGDGGAKGVQDSLVTIDDAGSITIPAGQTVDGMDPSAHVANPIAHQNAPALIATHAALSSAHHVRYTDAEARASINNIFGSDGKADADIDLDGNDLSNVGTIDLDGGQIAFPATAVPSADPNTLDDYEEGTWTPVLTFGGASVDLTYGNQTGVYVKIGKQVTLRFRILLTNKGTSSGAAVITGNTFTIASPDSPGSLRGNKLHYANVPFLLGVATTTGLYLYETTEAGVQTQLVDTDFENTTDLYGTVVFFI